jgi:hypothetical protein
MAILLLVHRPSAGRKVEVAAQAPAPDHGVPVAPATSPLDAPATPPPDAPPVRLAITSDSPERPGSGGPRGARLELVGDPDQIIEQARRYGFEIRLRGGRPPARWRGRVVFDQFTLYFDTLTWHRIEGDLAGFDLSSPLAVRFAGGRLVPASGTVEAP